MAHKKNGKSKANNQRIIKLPPCNRKMMSIFQPQLGSSKKAVAAEAPDTENQAVSEVVIQQQQLKIDKVVSRIVKSEERVTAYEDRLASACHVYVCNPRITHCKDR